MQAAIREGMMKIKCMIPPYWTEFEIQNGFEDDWELSPVDPPEYLEAMMLHIRSHELEHGHLRTHMTEEARLQVTALETCLVSSIDDQIEDVRNFSWHISLKRTIDTAWQQSYYSPKAGCFYMLWDHMAP